MKIFTYFDPNHPDPPQQAEQLRIFVRSWEANGWTVRVVIPRIIKNVEGPSIPIRVLRAMGGGWFAELYRDNHGFTPKKARVEARGLKESNRIIVVSGLCYLPR